MIAYLSLRYWNRINARVTWAMYSHEATSRSVRS